MTKKKSRRRSSDQAKVRYAVVGAGHIAQVAMLPAFAHARETSELVALISSDPVKRKQLARKYRLDHTGDYDELEDVLAASGADAVYVAVPNHAHRTITERALAAGAHVLCEKPMAITEADCKAMIAAAQRADRRLMIAYRLHLDRATLRAIDLAHRGKLGELRYFSSVFSHQIRAGDIRTESELGGGALYDLGPYCINAARHLFRAEPTEVSAFQVRGVDERSEEVDEMTSALLRFPGGRVAQFTVSQGAAAISNYRIVGTKGDLRVEPGFEYVDGIVHFLTRNERTKERAFPRTDQFAPQLVELSRCIRENLEPESSGDEGLADVRVLQAIARSAATGKAVTLLPHARAGRPESQRPIAKPPIAAKPRLVHASSSSS